MGCGASSPNDAKNAPAGRAKGVRISEEASMITQTKWDVIVIGSGYGGSIAASRLARTGKSVCVLEKGKEWVVGEYPETLWDVQNQVQVHKDGGHILGNADALYDFHLHKDINVYKGCGLGGTSLVNANVALEADPRVFSEPLWPKEILDEIKAKSFNQWYDKAREMLQPNPYPDDRPLLPKMKAMEAAAAFENGGDKFYRPDIVVNFKENYTNKMGIKQNPCNDCGDCCTGCNVGAKNTTLMNYLPDAKNYGAKIYTQADVRRISKREKGDEYKWTVWYNPIGTGREAFPDEAKEMFLEAKVVVVSGGTLGSTEILLRSKNSGLNLPESLGEKFSGNGDLLACAFDTKYEIENIVNGERKVGPCITSIIDKRKVDDLMKGFVVEDGTHPIAIAKIFAGVLSTAYPYCNETLASYLSETADVLTDSVGAFGRSLSFLIMAQDTAQGRMRLEKDQLVVDWPNAGKEPFIENAYSYLKGVSSQALGGHMIEDPVTSDFFNPKQLITVHPLGGCVMGSSAANSVVNHACQVWNPAGGLHEGLYVMDGAVIPSCVGVNPFFTICAVSERAVSNLAAQQNWTVEGGFKEVVAATEKSSIGIAFTETMKGWFSVGETKSYEEGKKIGKKSNTQIAFTVTITTDDVDKMLASPEHEGLITGTLHVPIISPNRDLVVTKGVFNLFVNDPETISQKLMKYQMEVMDEKGNPYLFTGFKVIKDNMAGLNTWEQTTTLYITMYKGTEAKAKNIFGKGIIYIAAADFARQLTTLSVQRAPNKTIRLQYLAKFGRYFAGSLWEIYGRVGATMGEVTVARRKRPLRLPVPEVYDVTTPDGLLLRLTRYAQPEGVKAKGPLLMLHGMGVSSRIFCVDTIQTSLAEFLHEHEYDLWLLDFRLSTDLPYAASLKNLDVVAQNDFAVSIDKILAVTEKKDVQVLCHCAGSSTFFMAMCSGQLAGKVRCIVASNVVMHAVTSEWKTVQSDLHLPDVLGTLNIHSVNPAVDEGLFNKLISTQAAAAVKPHEFCSNAVCHRISFLYGLLWEHSQLNPATHDAMHEYFGPGSVSIFSHFSAIVRKGHVVNANEEEVYLPRAAQNLKLPIFILSGEKNAIWLPESTQKSYNFLAEANTPDLYTRDVVPGYGHLDCIYGKNADKDVFPRFLNFLDAHL